MSLRLDINNEIFISKKLIYWKNIFRLVFWSCDDSSAIKDRFTAFSEITGKGLQITHFKPTLYSQKAYCFVITASKF